MPFTDSENWGNASASERQLASKGKTEPLYFGRVAFHAASWLLPAVKAPDVEPVASWGKATFEVE